MKIWNKLGTAFLLVWIVSIVLTACASPIQAQGGPPAGSEHNARSGPGQGVGRGTARSGGYGYAGVGAGVSGQALAERKLPFVFSGKKRFGQLYLAKEFCQNISGT